jgi:hypothetical protein
MIKLESVHVEELRGIRKLDLNFKQKTFAISGQNGSGKSGVIDAIEFCLTGEIGRLTGRGTKGLSVAEHGPHVDKTKFPGAAFVSLKVFLPEIKKFATITRKIDSPKEPAIEPPDEDIKRILADVGKHPEVTLTRREVIRFILVEPTKRSDEIQALLKLEEIGQTRAALSTAQNRLGQSERAATAAVANALNTLRVHLQSHDASVVAMLDSINRRRAELGLKSLDALSEHTKVDDGINETKERAFNKASALRDLDALGTALFAPPPKVGTAVMEIRDQLRNLENDPTLLLALQRSSLIELGYNLVDSRDCPLCDKAWEDEAALKRHLRTKLDRSAQAKKTQASLLANGGALAIEIDRLTGLLAPVITLAKDQGQNAFEALLNEWKTVLSDLRKNLQNLDGILASREVFERDWLKQPDSLAAHLKKLVDVVSAKPDQASLVDAQTYLTKAQLRFADYWSAKKTKESAKLASATAKVAYDTYCTVLENELNTLYNEVQDDFSSYYREINDEDEGKFTAKLTPSAGKLDLDVNFYERGLFPPAAFHSEGHQDGMGVCLYLALMKRLFGPRFTFALLDDVVMSVDSGHRYQFCKLLKVKFPDTQFILTTHDKLWAAQMRSAGLVTNDSSVVFHSWSVDTGPLIESGEDIWREIDDLLTKGKVETAAAALRRHLEYVSRQLADSLGATPQFRDDGDYELGELLPAVIGRFKKLYGEAAKAAQSWGDLALRDSIKIKNDEFSEIVRNANVEQWAVNKAVHYNAWANFGKRDFEPVVQAFKKMLAALRCPTCNAFVYLNPKRSPESLRCACNALNLNLNEK